MKSEYKPQTIEKGENKMDQNKVAELLAALAGEGFQYGDIMKALKGAKDAGIIKAKGRGKVPENDPLRISVRDALLAIKVNGKTLVDQITEATKETSSFMLTLNDNFKVNFVKNMPKEKKDKQEKKAKGPDSFEEPAVA